MQWATLTRREATRATLWRPPTTPRPWKTPQALSSSSPGTSSSKADRKTRRDPLNAAPSSENPYRMTLHFELSLFKTLHFSSKLYSLLYSLFKSTAKYLIKNHKLKIIISLPSSISSDAKPIWIEVIALAQLRLQPSLWTSWIARDPTPPMMLSSMGCQLSPRSLRRPPRPTVLPGSHVQSLEFLQGFRERLRCIPAQSYDPYSSACRFLGRKRASAAAGNSSTGSRRPAHWQIVWHLRPIWGVQVLICRGKEAHEPF